MSTLPYQAEFIVPADGTITLPEPFRGRNVSVISPPNPLDHKTLDEIIEEQGGPKICRNVANLSRDFPKIWDTEEELEEFLRKRKEEI